MAASASSFLEIRGFPHPIAPSPARVFSFAQIDAANPCRCALPVIRPTGLFSENASSKNWEFKGGYLSFTRTDHRSISRLDRIYPVVDIRAAATTEKRKAFYPGEKKGFVEEMRRVAMKLHTKDQSVEGEQKANEKPLAKWEPSVQGYLKFLVDSKAVYDTLESLVHRAAHPSYAEFRNTGLERSAHLATDLEWFKNEGHEIPEPGEPGLSYSSYLSELAETDPPAFICHFYNVYFAHSAGGRMIGKQVAGMILNGKELEFYKWDADLKEMLAAVKEKLNKTADGWTRDEKDRCLQETEQSFMNSGKLLRLIVS